MTSIAQMIERGLEMDLATDASQSLLPREGLGCTDHPPTEDQCRLYNLYSFESGCKE